jgi:hypothetical protein
MKIASGTAWFALIILLLMSTSLSLSLSVLGGRRIQKMVKHHSPNPTHPE